MYMSGYVWMYVYGMYVYVYNKYVGYTYILIDYKHVPA